MCTNAGNKNKWINKNMADCLNLLPSFTVFMFKVDGIKMNRRLTFRPPHVSSIFLWYESMCPLKDFLICCYFCNTNIVTKQTLTSEKDTLGKCTAALYLSHLDWISSIDLIVVKPHYVSGLWVGHSKIFLCDIRCKLVGFYVWVACLF